MRAAFKIQPTFFDSRTNRLPAPQFGEPSLAYDPPYERVLDDQMVWLLVRYLHPASELQYRKAIPTAVGVVVVDFLVERGSHRAAFLLADSSEDEVNRPTLDPYWHAMLVGSGAVDVVYVVSGERLAERAADVLAVIAGWQADLFSPDGLAELAGATAGASVQCSLSGTGIDVRLRYGAAIADVYHDEHFEWPESGPSEVTVSRRSGSVLASLGRKA